LLYKNLKEMIEIIFVFLLSIPFLVSLPFHPFSPPFPEKGQGRDTRKVFLTKNLFEGRATTQTKKAFFFVNHFLKRYFLFQNGFFFLKRYFLFVSWPSIQIPFLLGKVLENFVSLGKPCIPSKNIQLSNNKLYKYITIFLTK